jgi:hypothetical protein
MKNLTFDSLLFEPCEAYRAPLDHDEPLCASCGHLADDHDRAEAQVTELPRRRHAGPRPVRKAS